MTIKVIAHTGGYHGQRGHKRFSALIDLDVSDDGIDALGGEVTVRPTIVDGQVEWPGYMSPSVEFSADLIQALDLLDLDPANRTAVEDAIARAACREIERVLRHSYGHQWHRDPAFARAFDR